MGCNAIVFTSVNSIQIYHVDLIKVDWWQLFEISLSFLLLFLRIFQGLLLLTLGWRIRFLVFIHVWDGVVALET